MAKKDIQVIPLAGQEFPSQPVYPPQLGDRQFFVIRYYVQPPENMLIRKTIKNELTPKFSFKSKVGFLRNLIF